VLEILSFETLASTSTYVVEQLKNGKSAPFAAIAQQQTGGRGRRGRSWVSPVGGIYLSVALLPPPIDPTLLGNISLWVGIEISRWLNQRFGFNAALKWPNDLMYDGRKLGGILIESGIEGQKQGPLIIGVGLNFHAIPETPVTDIDALPISISEIAPCETLNTSELGRDLIAHIESAWNSPAFIDTLKAVEKVFLTKSPPLTRLWCDKENNEFWWQKDILKDGSLSLEKIGSTTERVLHSADHRLTVGKKHDPLPVVMADVGNSSIKIHGYQSYWHSEPFIKIRHFHSEKDYSVLEHWLVQAREQMPASNWPLLVSGVEPLQMKRLKDAATKVGFLPIDVQKQPVRVHGTYPLDQIGFDRLCMMEGWLTSKPDSNVVAVIVSFGTAITVDVVKGSGLHKGGVIAPGFGLALKSLHENAALLPEVTVAQFSAENALGHSTVSAISAGVFQSGIGLIEKIIRSTSESENIPKEHIKLIICGGDADLAKSFLPNAEVSLDLLFKGLKSMAAGGIILKQ
jgi:biotin-[acetyl-CoA-carboxylase] ligase BirA-like protein